MPRIPRISRRSRKAAGDAPEPTLEIPETGADAPQPAAEAPQPTADLPQPAAEAPQPTANLPQPAADTPQAAVEAPQPGGNPEPIAAAVEGTASTRIVTTEFPVLGGEAPAPSAETTVMDSAPQALTGAVVAPDGGEAPATAEPEQAEQGSFVDRGRMRRRLRYLRRTRELAFRDLGGLLFDLHRFARSRDDLVHGKLTRLTAIDIELRALETALDDRQEVTVLREPGLAACPRCGALHGSDANYCPMCALPVRPGAGLPVASQSPAPPEAPVAEG
jgi:hypothetical protein